jgi:hypothetical protein
MKIYFLSAAALLFLGASFSLSASSVCPSTPSTTSDCDFLITIDSTGMASVSQVAGSTAFNSMVTFPDGTSDPGGDASLIGVVDDYSSALSSLTLKGSGANAGIFDFSFNGICVYTSASYCATAASGYEGPTTTFSSLMSTVPFQTNIGTVNFDPGLAPGQSTYFSLEDSAADITANGGLSVAGETFASTATPEPSEMALVGLGISLFAIDRKRWSAKRK